MFERLPFYLQNSYEDSNYLIAFPCMHWSKRNILSIPVYPFFGDELIKSHPKNLLSKFVSGQNLFYILSKKAYDSSK